MSAEYDADLAAEADVQTQADALANAERAVAELRAQIGLQVAAIESLDTKAAGLAGLSVAVLGIVASRIKAETDPQLIVAAIGVVMAVTIAICLVQALRPRDGASYGADAEQLRAIADEVRPPIFALSLMDSLVKARARNADYIETRAGWLLWAFWLALLEIVDIGALAQTGALR